MSMDLFKLRLSRLACRRLTIFTKISLWFEKHVETLVPAVICGSGSRYEPESLATSPIKRYRISISWLVEIRWAVTPCKNSFGLDLIKLKTDSNIVGKSLGR